MLASTRDGVLVMADPLGTHHPPLPPTTTTTSPPLDQRYSTGRMIYDALRSPLSLGRGGTTSIWAAPGQISTEMGTCLCWTLSATKDAVCVYGLLTTVQISDISQTGQTRAPQRVATRLRALHLRASPPLGGHVNNSWDDGTVRGYAMLLRPMYAMPCRAVPCHAMPCRAMLCHATTCMARYAHALRAIMYHRIPDGIGEPNGRFAPGSRQLNLATKSRV